MKLFQVLFRRRGLPNGNIYTGKHRLVKPVTKEDLRKLRDEYAIEERNMFLLRNSYLTKEQSLGHSQALGKRQEGFDKIKYRKKDFYDHVKIEARLGHLRHSESWD